MTPETTTMIFLKLACKYMRIEVLALPNQFYVAAELLQFIRGKK